MIVVTIRYSGTSMTPSFSLSLAHLLNFGPRPAQPSLLVRRPVRYAVLSCAAHLTVPSSFPPCACARARLQLRHLGHLLPKPLLLPLRPSPSLPVPRSLTWRWGFDSGPFCTFVLCLISSPPNGRGVHPCDQLLCSTCVSSLGSMIFDQLECDLIIQIN